MASPTDVQGAFLSGLSIGEKKLAALLLASGAVRGVDLRRLLEAMPKRPLLYLLFEERLVDAAELDRLIAHLEQERESHISEGDRLCRIANPGLAVERYSQALDLQPRDADAFRRRGIALALLHQAKEALEDLDRAVALAPRDHAALGARALVRHELGDEPGAIEDLSLAISIAPCGRYHADRARIWSARGEDGHALADWSRALDLAPDWVEWRHHRALALLRSGDFDGACGDFVEVIERAGRSSSIWGNARIVVGRLVVEGRVGPILESRARDVLARLESPARHVPPDHLPEVADRVRRPRSKRRRVLRALAVVALMAGAALLVVLARSTEESRDAGGTLVVISDSRPRQIDGAAAIQPAELGRPGAQPAVRTEALGHLRRELEEHSLGGGPLPEVDYDALVERGVITEEEARAHRLIDRAFEGTLEEGRR